MNKPKACALVLQNRMEGGEFMDKIHISDITEITKDRICFRDERGDTCFIELAPCANSYEAVHSVLNKSDLKLRCVGERSFGKYAYYELYTIGHTQIYMNLRTNTLKRVISKIFGWNFHTKEFQAFYSIQKRLNENGWTTFDLT